MAGKRWWICEALREPMFQVAQAFLMLCTYCAKSTNIINLMFRSLYENLRGLLQRWSAPKISAGNMDFSRLLADAQKESNRLWESPPLCGTVIRYIHQHGYGEFMFKTADVETALRDSLRKHPHLANDDEVAILNWVQRHDDSVTEPSDVPSIWSRFKYVANDLVRAGKAEIHCRECNAIIELHNITRNDDSSRPGWNYDRVVCPHGHDLLVVESVHLMSN